MKKPSSPTTGVLPPSSPSDGITPAYDCIEDIIYELWDYCMELEDEYHKTGNHSVLCQFAITIMAVQYWEDILLSMEGVDVFGFYF